jgi:tRNA dimethylallyltransferase
MAPSKPKLVIITGPTGAGKSEAALFAAEALSAEIINADSVAFYRLLDIGSAKPTVAERERVRHHLIDVVDPDEDFNASDFMRVSRKIAQERIGRGGVPLVVGGTGLYLRSLEGGLFDGPGRDAAYRSHLEELRLAGGDLYEKLKREDPEAAAVIRPSDRSRIVRALEVRHLSGESIVGLQRRHALSDRPFETLTLVLDRPKEEMGLRIAARTKKMFDGGFAEEVEGILRLGYSPDLKPLMSVGYLECVDLIKGKINRAEAENLINLRTMRLAKRQRTWFRGQSPGAVWLAPDGREVLDRAGAFLGA